jgi:RNA-directed DNA polymerase
MVETKAPVAIPSEDWAQLPWRKLEQYVYRLQKRIYRAASRGNVQAVHRLEQLLMQSHAARTLAVRRVTQDNQGKKTAGVDGVANVPAPLRLALVDHIHPKNDKSGRKAAPTRRVWIPKPGKTEKRPLGIPTMRDRAKQALAKLALEPEWEAKFEPNSYGFRPGRSAHDAIEAIFLDIRYQPKYVLDADIKGCFDTISHEALLRKLNTYPAMRQAIKAWLKAGVLESGDIFPTEQGTPQGGVISPLLANIALHGMEQAVRAAFTFKEGKPYVVRYADDFVVLHPTEAGVEKAQRILTAWLAEVGLVLHPTKTRITHTLRHPGGSQGHETGDAGFDFLGFTARQFPVGLSHTGALMRKPLGFKTIIQPSKDAVKRHVQELGQVVRANRAAAQADLIAQLNPKIQGWANYYRTVCAKETFSTCDHLLYGQLRHWARHRHPHKGGHWVKERYWNDEWRFQAPGENTLGRHSRTSIRRHIKVRGTASPYDGNLIYWSQRLQHHPLTTGRMGKLLIRQQGKCMYCGLRLKAGDLLEIDHIVPRALEGDNDILNLQILHRHCHDQKTARDGSIARAS